MTATRGTSPDPLVLIIDDREKRPLAFGGSVRTVRKHLKTGDYSVEGYEDQFTVERKSIPDLIATLTARRERFERELQRMAGIGFRRVVVEGSLRQVVANAKRVEQDRWRRVRVNSIIGTIFAFEVRYGVPFVFAANGPGEAAWRVEKWARYFVRERRIREAAVLSPAPSPYEVD